MEWMGERDVMIWIVKTLRRLEANVQSRVGSEDIDDYTKAGRVGESTTKNRPSSEGVIKIGVVGRSVFGVGLHRCE